MTQRMPGNPTVFPSRAPRLPLQARQAYVAPNGYGGQDAAVFGPVPSVDVAPHQTLGNLMPVQETVESNFIVSIPGVTNFYCTPISSLMAAGADSSQITIQFLEAGWITSLAADPICPLEASTPMTPEAARCSIGLRVIDATTRAQLMQNGNGEQPMALSQIVGGDGSRVWPLVRRVAANDKWQMTFTNLTAAISNLRAQASFGFLADPRSIR